MSDPLRIILHNDQTEAMASRLHARFPDVACRPCNSYDALSPLIGDFRPDIVYSVRFDGTPNYPRDALFGPDGPAWVANGGAGTDHFGQWDAKRTVVTNAAGVAADVMAEYVLGGFLHFTLDVPGLQNDKATRTWRSRRVVPLSGKTLLIIGLGHTGRAIAGRAKAFGMQVIGTRATPEPMENVDEVHAADALMALLPRADFIAICTPLTPATRRLIAWPHFDAMRPGVILADVSRGGVVDQSDLLNALRTGQVAGAALDVFETEPLPPDSPLWDAEGVIISPHCASVYEGWEEASFALFLRNLERWIAKEPLLNVVDPVKGY